MIEFIEGILFAFLLNALFLILIGTLGYYLLGKGILGILISQGIAFFFAMLFFASGFSLPIVFSIFFSNILILFAGFLGYYLIGESMIDKRIIPVIFFQAIAIGVMVILLEGLIGAFTITI